MFLNNRGGINAAVLTTYCSTRSQLATHSPLDLTEHNTIKPKRNKRDTSNNNRAQNTRVGPWTSRPAPRDAHKEEHRASDEKEHPDVIKLLDLLPLGLALDVQLGVCRRVVKEEVEQRRDPGEDGADVEAPSPALFRVLDEAAGDYGAEDWEVSSHPWNWAGSGTAYPRTA